jgi:hypothetical protein
MTLGPALCHSGRVKSHNALLLEQSTLCPKIETGHEPEPAVTIRVAHNASRRKNVGDVESIETITLKAIDYDNQIRCSQPCMSAWNCFGS